MIIIDQNVNMNDQRRNLSLQTGIWKFNRRNITLPLMKYNENSVKLNGKTYNYGAPLKFSSFNIEVNGTFAIHVILHNSLTQIGNMLKFWVLSF